MVHTDGTAAQFFEGEVVDLRRRLAGFAKRRDLTMLLVCLLLLDLESGERDAVITAMANLKPRKVVHEYRH